MMHSMTDGQIWAMWIGLTVFWATLLGFGIWLVARLTRRPRDNEADRILRERYARGEIDAEEFRIRSERLAAPDDLGPRTG